MDSKLFVAISLFSILMLGCTIPFIDQPPNPPLTPPSNGTITPPGRDPSNPYINVIVPNETMEENITFPPIPPIIPPENQTNQTANMTGNKTDKIGSDLRLTPTPFSDLEIYFISSGGGDAILIRKGSFTMLLDAGAKVSASALVEKLRSYGIVRLEVAAVSSPTDDNTGGMPEILRSLPVTEYWDNNAPPGNFSNTKLYAELMDEVSRKGFVVKHPEEGDRLSINGMEIEVLNPPQARSLSSPAIDSLVFKITNNQYCVMLMGNSVTGVENRIAGTGKDIRCDLIKISDHASGFATEDLLITRVRPTSAIIIEGTSPPNPTILERLRLKGVNTTSTRVAIGQAIRVTSDGTSPFGFSSG